MRAAVRAEFLRLAGTPVLRRFLLAGAAVGLLLTGGMVLLGPEHMNPPMPLPDTEEGIHGLLGLLVLSAPVPVLLGSRLMTNEREYRTIVPSLLVQPHRRVLVGAKVVVALGAGLAYGLLLALAAALGLLESCALVGITPALDAAAVVAECLRIGAAMSLYTLIGVGLGALLGRAQACLAVSIGWFYLLESMLSAVPALNRLYPWLPGGAASALTGRSFVLDAISRTTEGVAPTLLPAWGGVLVLLGYAAVACLAAGTTTLRADVH